LERATGKAKKEYFESIWAEIMEFQSTGRYDLIAVKTNELNWKENLGIQNIDTEDSKGLQ
jgi:hypothetical protein